MTSKKKDSRRQLAAAAIAAAVLLFGTIIDYAYHRNRIYSGIYVDDYYIGGKTVAEATLLLQQKLASDKFFNTLINFKSGDYELYKTFAELGIRPDVDLTVTEAFGAGRQKMHLLSYPERIAMAGKGRKVELLIVTDREQFESGISEAAGVFWREPVNAEFKLSDDLRQVHIEPDVAGRELDYSATYRRLQEALQAYPDLPKVEFALNPVEAERTAAFLESLQVKEPIASFSSEFSFANANRVHNIRLAAAALDNTIIPEDHTFSFNDTVGNTTAAKGYKTAPVIVQGELVEGLGGGICQVSSTLYNAVLLADLSIVERRNHSLVVGYLPPGLDATVAYNSIDFKFKNVRNHGLWLRTFIDGGKLTVKIYGTAVPGQAVKVVTQNLQVIPAGEKITETPSLPKGTRERVKDGQPGYKVAVYRILYVNGEELLKEKISQDAYKAVPAEYLVGTGAFPAAAKQQENEELRE